MPNLLNRQDSFRRPRRGYDARRGHDHDDRDTNHEFDRLYSLIQRLRSSASAVKELSIVNTLGSAIGFGTVLGWTSAGVLALADAGDGTSTGTKIRPLMVSPGYIVPKEGRFKPHGTGELAYVQTDGTGTYTIGKRLVCSATAGKATVTAPASPDKIFSVGWVSGELDTDTNLILARLDLGAGTTT